MEIKYMIIPMLCKHMGYNQLLAADALTLDRVAQMFKSIQ